MPYGLVTGIASIGVLETAYLTGVKLFGAPLVCPVSGCETVLNSAYAELFGIPLSFFGMLTYGAVGAAAAAAASQSSKGLPTSTEDSALAAGTALLAGVSGVLIYLLQTRFGGEWCAWCYLSAGLSLSLAGITFASMPRRQMQEAAGPSLGVVAAAIAALYLGIGQVDKSIADDFELPYSAPEVSTQSSPEAKSLAKKLKEAGAKMYGAFWCSHCFDQKQAFGAQAMSDFPYVECYPDGWKKGVKVVDACDAAGVRAFPTWVINGKVVEGELTLEALQKELDAGTERVAPPPKPPSPFADK